MGGIGTKAQKQSNVKGIPASESEPKTIECVTNRGNTAGAESVLLGITAEHDIISAALSGHVKTQIRRI